MSFFFIKQKTALEITPCLEFRRVLFRFQAEDGIRDHCVTGVQTCALPIYGPSADYGGNGNADADNMVAGSGGKDTGWQAAAISDLFQVESVKRREKGLQ